MNKLSKLVFSLFACYFSFSGVAQALPGMNADEVVEWFNDNRSVAPLHPTDKYEEGMSDFDSFNRVKDGSLHLTVFLDDNSQVLAETIDYRPECWQSSECRGMVRFEKADRSDGQNLIRSVFGQEILDDFQSSKLMESVYDFGPKRWYQGEIYNYETWHYENYKIVHFTVVSKKDNQGERIRGFRDSL
jgi:hypothetical protein